MRDFGLVSYWASSQIKHLGYLHVEKKAVQSSHPPFLFWSDKPVEQKVKILSILQFTLLQTMITAYGVL